MKNPTSSVQDMTANPNRTASTSGRFLSWVSLCSFLSEFLFSLR